MPPSVRFASAGVTRKPSGDGISPTGTVAGEQLANVILGRYGPDTPVLLRVDGVEEQTQRLSIAAGESAGLVFFHKFDEGGPHTIEIALSDGVLAADDAYRVAVNVIEC